MAFGGRSRRGRRRRTGSSTLGAPLGVPSDRIAGLVVGAQRGWFERCADPEPVAANVQSVLGRLRGAGVAVVSVVHRRPVDRPPRRGAPPEDTSLVDVGVVPDLLVDAAGHDAFYGGRLRAELAAAQRDVLLVMGFGQEGPVESTVRSATDLGLRAVIVPECCAWLGPSRSRGGSTSGRHRVESLGLDELVDLLDEADADAVRR